MEWALSIFDAFRQYFTHHLVFSMGLLLLGGYFFGQLAEKCRLPAITGYIIAGLVLGESVLGLIPKTIAVRLTSVTEVALALIAITIGAEFDIQRLKKSGLNILLMTIFEAIFAAIAVFTVFLLLGMDTRYALLLGAIAAATAPAATVIIVRQLKVRGEFIQYLYGVVAFDDAVCIILFSIVFAVVGPVLAGNAAMNNGVVLSGFVHAFSEIGLSFGLGLLTGLLLHVIVRRIRRRNEIMIITLSVVFMLTSISIVLHLSLLIANMTLGAMLINLSPRNREIFDSVSPIAPPLFALFFILAGAELDVKLFAEGAVVLYGLAYLVSRFLGKYAGVFFSGTITKAPRNIRNYLGFCLFPQAGVAIGLVLLLQTSPLLASASGEVKAALVLIVNVVLLSIFINELVGPSISRFGIVKGMGLTQDIKPKTNTVIQEKQA